ncbi:MAG: hypothetical protein K1V81_05185 [Paramuribaculum sp.]|jgi:hypothetical protein
MRSILAFIISAVILGGCGRDSGRLNDPNHILTIDELTADTVDRWSHPLAELPEPTVKMKINNIGPLAKVFNDSNYIHWEEAEKTGITPLNDTRSHWQSGRDMVKVVSCADFYVEPLTHSRPFMVPEGAAMLHEIGRRFRDSLEARGGGDYRIKVTSVLRTPLSVKRLRRSNRNAVDSSVHQLGTTVDISYSRFAPDGDRIPRSMEDLKNLLGEVLWAMRSEGKCLVKYERKQPCFHVTVCEGAYPDADI